MKILDSLLALQSLEYLPRLGWAQHGIANPESVAAHSFGVATIALALCSKVEPPLDRARVLSMAVAHDLPEAWLGDLPKSAKNLLPKGLKTEAELRAAEALLAPFSEEVREEFREYLEHETREARFVKLCDGLQLGLRVLAYRRAGQAGLDDFEEGLRELDASEFEVTESLRADLLAALDAIR